MKKTDIGVVGFMYAVCVFFFAMAQDLKKDAQVYPVFIITLLFLLIFVLMTAMNLMQVVADRKKIADRKGH